MSKQHVQIAERLYECRDTARRLMREKYGEQVRPWMEALEAISVGGNMSIMDASLRVVKDMSEQFNGPGMMWAAAATVELIEPDELTPARAEDQ